MKINRILSVLVAVCMGLTLCGCGFSGMGEELVSPPELTGEMRPIGEALTKSAGQSIDLKYPTSGDRRSAIVLEDINADGIFEAFAFYSTADDEMTNMHINVIRQSGESWMSVADQTIVATGVEMVDFCDLDADGVLEIVVGWEVNGNTDKQLSVFDFENDTLTQKLLQPYTGFVCCDLDSNGTNEIFVHLINTTDKTNKAMLYSHSGGTMQQSHECYMDSGVKTASRLVLSELSNGQRAIYIDEIKGVGAVTEVIYLAQGELRNPLLDTEGSYENFATLRAASLQMSDINADNVLEIPVASDLPNAKDDERLYYTNWCSFNGEALAVKLVTVVNTVDGYYLAIPSNMVGKIAVVKDIENHKREFYMYDAATAAVGERLFTINAVPLRRFESKDYNADGTVEIARNDSTVFTASASGYANGISITTEVVKGTFNLIE